MWQPYLSQTLYPLLLKSPGYCRPHWRFLHRPDYAAVSHEVDAYAVSSQICTRQYLSGDGQKSSLSNSSGIYFNVSHSNQFALYVISTVEKTGVDIEHIHSDIEVDAIAKQFFSSYENQQLSSTHEKILPFFQIWTYKEAFLKAMGDGLSFLLKDFDVDIQENRLIEIRGKEGEIVKDWSLLTLTLDESYSASLAVKAKLNKIERWQFSFDF